MELNILLSEPLTIEKKTHAHSTSILLRLLNNYLHKNNYDLTAHHVSS